VITVNSAVLIRYVPAVRIASWRPFSPPLARNARASWKLSQGTERARMRSDTIGAPALASTSPILPAGIRIIASLMHAVLEEPVAEVQSGRERVGLVTGLAVERDELTRRELRAPNFLITTPTSCSLISTMPSQTGHVTSVISASVPNSTPMPIHE
jgi:hypothetical protein